VVHVSNATRVPFQVLATDKLQCSGQDPKRAVALIGN